VQGIAAVGDQVALLVQIEQGGDDEYQVLFEQGYLNEDSIDTYCFGNFEGDDFVGYACDYEDYEEAMEDEFVVDAPEFVEDVVTATTLVIPATTLPPRGDDVAADEEALIFESEAFDDAEIAVEEEEIFRLAPGDAGYDEIFEIYNSFEDYAATAPIVMAGTVGGNFTATELPVEGYSSGLVGTDSGFAVLINDFELGTNVVLSSTDGVTWSQGAPVGAQGGVNGIIASGDRLLATVQTFDGINDGIEAWVSDDLGNTWSSESIDSALFNAYGMPIAGPAGFALQLDGTTEPYEDNYVDPFEGIASLDIVKDGFTMTIDLGNGTATLIGPDGAVIHESVEEGLFSEDIENVVRFDGRFGETITWLDPETGEDLVTITEDDVNAVFDEFYNEEAFIGLEGDYVEPPRGNEIWFSADGANWTLLDATDVDFSNDGESYSSLAGVGDDEVLVHTETWVEPPEELFSFESEGREPTAEEADAMHAWYEQANDASIEWTVIPVA